MAARKKYSHFTKAPALGHELGALISTDNIQTRGNSTINEMPIEQIEVNPNQSRREFDQEALEELASSIREIDIIQPITPRQVAADRCQIVAGERRWRASQIVDLEAIPAYIRTIDDEMVMEMALVENIQRKDLNAIKVALAYEKLIEKSGMMQEKVSRYVGKSRTATTNYLRLLKLPAQVQMVLQKKEIDMGYARALLAVESPSTQIKLFREVQKNGYPVRKVEELVQQLKNGGELRKSEKHSSVEGGLPEEFDVLRLRLSTLLKTKVQMTCSAKGRGKISIPFANEQESERLVNIFDKLKD